MWEPPKHVLQQGIPRGLQIFSWSGLWALLLPCTKTQSARAGRAHRPCPLAGRWLHFPPAVSGCLSRDGAKCVQDGSRGRAVSCTSCPLWESSGLRWPNTLPIPCWGCWAGSILPVQGMAADIPLLIPPSCCPARLGSHPGSKRGASVHPVITHLPALPSSLCLSRYLPLCALPAPPISPLLLPILIEMSHFAGMVLPGQGKPGLLESAHQGLEPLFQTIYERAGEAESAYKSTKQPARSSDPSQGVAPCAANTSARGNPEPATAFVQGKILVLPPSQEQSGIGC